MWQHQKHITTEEKMTLLSCRWQTCYLFCTMIYAQFSGLIMVRWPFVERNEHANKHTNWSDYNYELKPVKMVKYAAFNGSLKIVLIIIGATSGWADVGDDNNSSSSSDNNNNNNEISSQPKSVPKGKIKKKRNTTEIHSTNSRTDNGHPFF